ncbi:hypothetical protein GIB67_002340, partial [Kingdonia uniflora]
KKMINFVLVILQQILCLITDKRSPGRSNIFKEIITLLPPSWIKLVSSIKFHKDEASVYQNILRRSFMEEMDSEIMPHCEKLHCHLLNVKVPLILGKHSQLRFLYCISYLGGKGQGKSFQTELIFQAMGVEPVIMSAGELESDRAGFQISFVGSFLCCKFENLADLSVIDINSFSSDPEQS